MIGFISSNKFLQYFISLGITLNAALLVAVIEIQLTNADRETKRYEVILNIQSKQSEIEKRLLRCEKMLGISELNSAHLEAIMPKEQKFKKSL